ncbi:glutaredoxin family protein [Prochlorococcus sp. MIT 1300]|uniref:glutaredoxin family protein n=1 Tax=Prochlorococcus sp. MIT 1300 TaxID=3096218 RepID=UPI002A7639F6|nr:glutaredoxin family protein [Prochlorococcus sp. MIT 1300]
MAAFSLVLYTRKGCCLCEGLEKKLRELKLNKVTPQLSLRVVDIDHQLTPADVRERYNLEVPVMCIGPSDSLHKLIPLPRVSPRLNGEGLLKWLQKTCLNALESF